MIEALASQTRRNTNNRRLPLGSINRSLDQNEWVVLIKSQTDSTKPELHLKPYQISQGIYQFGLNGVVESSLTAANFSEPDPVTQPKLKTSYLTEISAFQIKLPFPEPPCLAKFIGFYGSVELAEWAIKLELLNPGGMFREDIVAQLPPTIAQKLLLNQTHRSTSYKP